MQHEAGKKAILFPWDPNLPMFQAPVLLDGVKKVYTFSFSYKLPINDQSSLVNSAFVPPCFTRLVLF